MGLRITRQLVEVLASNKTIHSGTASNTLVVTQGVLLSRNLHVSSVISLTDHVTDSQHQRLSSVLSLTDHADHAKFLRVSSVLGLTQLVSFTKRTTAVHDVLSLSDHADSHQKVVHLASSLALSDIAYAGHRFLKSLSSTLSLSDNAQHYSTTVSLASSITLNQFAQGDTHVKSRQVASTVTMTDQVVLGNRVYFRSLPFSQLGNDGLHLSDSGLPGFHRVTASSLISISNSVSLTRVTGQSVTTTVSLSDAVKRQKPITASSLISLTDKAERVFQVSSVLSFVDVATFNVPKSVSSFLTMTDAVAVQGTFKRTLSTPLSMVHFVSPVVLDDALTCVFNPFIGSPGTPEVAPTLTTGTLVLSYPYDTPTSTVTLRNPDFGNQDTVSFDRISRQTAGGDLVIFADPKWPKQKTLQVTISALSDTQVSQVLTFFKTTLGKDIRLQDWEGRTWKGFVTTPAASVGRRAGCKNSLSFEFQGELQ